MKRIVGDDLARFESKVERVPMSGCWIWLGALDGRGYGHTWLRGETVKAHRAAWVLHMGEIPGQQWVLHRCDVPCCVNPAHLFIGDRTANMRDMASKGRQVFQAHPERAARGTRAAGAKLSEENVGAIRRRIAEGVAYSRIAAEFRVCIATIGHIATGRTWAHLANPRAEIEVEPITVQADMLSRAA